MILMTCYYNYMNGVPCIIRSAVEQGCCVTTMSNASVKLTLGLSLIKEMTISYHLFLWRLYKALYHLCACDPVLRLGKMRREHRVALGHVQLAILKTQCSQTLYNSSIALPIYA